MGDLMSQCVNRDGAGGVWEAQGEADLWLVRGRSPVRVGVLSLHRCADPPAPRFSLGEPSPAEQKRVPLGPT